MKTGDKIYFLVNDEFEVDRIKEIVEVDGNILITPKYFDWLTLTENDLLDETCEKVKNDVALHGEKQIKLSDARQWLQAYANNYYEADEWSDFHQEQLIVDFCKAMFYKQPLRKSLPLNIKKTETQRILIQ